VTPTFARKLRANVLSATCISLGQFTGQFIVPFILDVYTSSDV